MNSNVFVIVPSNNEIYIGFIIFIVYPAYMPLAAERIAFVFNRTVNCQKVWYHKGIWLLLQTGNVKVWRTILVLAWKKYVYSIVPIHL